MRRRTAALVIVVILIVAAAAYASFAEYQSYNSPEAVCQREGEQGDTEVGFILVSPTISVQSGTDTGILSVKVDGSGCAPITGFTITSIHPFVSGVANTSFVEYQGVPVSKTHPEPTDEPALGSIPVSNVTAGQRYSFVYVITLQSSVQEFSSSGANITFTAMAYTPVSTPMDQNLTAAVNYLVSNYNPKLGLLPETPGSSVYWLYSDNYLAAAALSQYGASNLAIVHTAANIFQSIERYLPVPDPESQYAVLGSNGVCSFPAAQNFTLATSDGTRIETDLNNGTELLSGAQYADIDFLDAVCQFHHGNLTEAMTAYDIGAKMFDGVGFRDLPYNETGQYQTYKLALFIYASVVLDQPVNTTALSTLLIMQAPDGGLYTGYNGSYSHGQTLTNTETTSLAVLALESVES